MLKKCGYDTEMIGKWHMGMYHKSFLPQNRGFDYFLGLYGGSADYYSHDYCFRNPRLNHDLYHMCGYDFREAYNSSETVRFDLNGTYSTDAFVTALDKRLENRTSKNPLFTYLSFQAVHGPIQTKPQFDHIYENVYKRKPKAQRTKMLSHITGLDDAVGRVVTSFKKHGYWENTVLIFSSDNGGSIQLGSSNWPLKGDKGSLHDGGIKVVGFLSSPLLHSTVV